MASDIDQLQTSHTSLDEKRKQVEEKKIESEKVNKLNKLKKANRYVIDENGVGRMIKKKNEKTGEEYYVTEYFISNRVRISAVCDDLDNDRNLFLLSIEDPDNGKIKEVWKEQGELTSKRGFYDLMNDGVIFNDTKAKIALDYFLYEINRAYLEEPRKVLASETGWKRDNTIFVSGNVAYENGKSYEIINTDDENKNTFIKKGTLDEWIAGTSEILKFKMTRTNCYVSVASQVNGILKQPSPLYLNCGKSSTGKTLSASVGNSMNGNPDLIVRSADASKTAAERIAAKTNGFCNTFDEADANDDISDFIYLLANGRGKDRGNTKGGIDKTARWYKSFLLTGENQINKESDNQGKVARLIEDRRILPNNPDLAKSVEETIKNNYGHLTELIVQKIFEQMDTLQQRYKEICKKLPSVSVDAGNRIKDSFALLILAGEILESVFADIGIETQDPYKLCEELYLENLDDERVDPYWKKGLNIILDEITNSHRERNDLGNYTNIYSLYGKPGITTSESYIDISPGLLKYICKLHDLKYLQLVREWKENGITECNTDRKDKKLDKQISIIGTYVIRIIIDRMNEVLETKFDHEAFALKFEGKVKEENEEFEPEEFEPQEKITDEERKQNLRETMEGIALEEKEEADKRDDTIVKPMSSSDLERKIKLIA